MPGPLILAGLGAAVTFHVLGAIALMAVIVARVRRGRA